jgi:hypothetical protein
MIAEYLGSIRGTEDDACHPCLARSGYLMGGHRHAGNWQHWLRRVHRERAKSRSLSPNQQYGLGHVNHLATPN